MGTSAATTLSLAARGLQQPAQRFQVFHVFTQLFAFWRFQNLRDLSKSSVSHEEPKCVQPYLALADVLMSIHPRAARRFGIVHVNRGETFVTNYSIEFAKCLLNGGFAADVIAGRKNV